MCFRQFLTEIGAGAVRYLYALADSDEQQAVVIDPLPAQTTLLRTLLAERDGQLWYVMRTHANFAETARRGDLCDCTGARLVLGPEAPFSGAKPLLHPWRLRRASPAGKSGRK